MNSPVRWWRVLLQRILSVVLAAGATLAIFLVLPFMQVIGNASSREVDVRSVDIAELPPPPPAPPEIEEEEEPPPPPPPEMIEEMPPLDLSQMELALNPTSGAGLFGDFTIDLGQRIGNAEQGDDLDKIFSLDDLDQRPRVVFQRPPTYPTELRRQRRNGTVQVVFIVDRDGRVLNPKIQRSSDPAFERPALEAVKQWKFEPGTRQGEKVQFKMRIPITFNAG